MSTLEKEIEKLEVEHKKYSYIVDLCDDMKKELKRLKDLETDPKKKIRIASWNLENFKGVKDEKIKSISLTIHKNDFHLVAFQEVMEVKDIEKVRDELNKMSKSNWECCFTEPIGKGMGGKEYGAFLWNISCGLAMQPHLNKEDIQTAISQVEQVTKPDADIAANKVKTEAQSRVKDAVKAGVKEAIMKEEIQLVKKAAQAAASTLTGTAKKEIQQVIKKTTGITIEPIISITLDQELVDAVDKLLTDLKMHELFQLDNIKKEAEKVLENAMTPKLHTLKPKKETKNPFARAPVCGKFCIQQWNFTLINFHLRAKKPPKDKPTNDDEVEAIHEVLEEFKDSPDEDIILLGDFNADIDCEHNEKLKKYKNIFLHEKTNYNRDECYDAIMVLKEKHINTVSDRYINAVSDRAVAVTYTSTAQLVSNHCPIYAEFIINTM